MTDKQTAIERMMGFLLEESAIKGNGGGIFIKKIFEEIWKI